MTNKVLLVLDGAAKDLKTHDFGVPKLEGFYHNKAKAPFRNVALGWKSVLETYPNADWYCYLEYDCLVASDRFKLNLEIAEKQKVWMLGCAGRVDDVRMPLVASIIGGCFLRTPYYLLGACQFMHKDFMHKLTDINFFERFLTQTNAYSEEIPGYSGYDLSEHMYPTLCRHFGGNIGVFSTFDGERWHGSSRYFPVRWRPELDPETENFPEASILHPLKDYHHPIRAFHRTKRHALSST